MGAKEWLGNFRQATKNDLEIFSRSMKNRLQEGKTESIKIVLNVMRKRRKKSTCLRGF